MDMTPVVARPSAPPPSRIPPRGGRSGWSWALALALVAVAAVWIGWVGYIASDDSLYWDGATKFVAQAPFAGDNHWSTRFPLLAVFAAMLALAGQNYAAFALTSLLFYVAVVAVTGIFAQRVAGRTAGWIAALLTAALPVVVSHASTVSVDLLEASALMLGALLLGGAGEGHAGLRAGFAGGVAFGVAILCRETSVLPLVALAPLFLRGRPVPRGALLAAALGTAAVLGAEALYQYALTGEPLRRYAIAFHHDEHIDRAANMEGNFLLWPPIDPLLVLLVNDDFGALFWLLGAALAGGVLRMLPERGRARLAVLAAMSAAMFLLVAVLVHKLVLNPRYFTLPALCAVVVVAAWLARLRPWPRTLLLAGVIGTNLLLLGVGNAHPRWAMDALVQASGEHPGEIVAGDPWDVRRANLVSMRYAARDNIRYAPAAPGMLEVAPADRAPPGTVVARYPSPPTRVGAILQATGLAALVPHAIAHRMFAPNPAMVLVRRPPRG